jgi:voltage-gated potassium channel
MEYLLRIWTADYKYPGSKYPRVRYFFSAAAIIDLAAILPFYLPFITGIDLRFLRILRLLRMFRIFKPGRYNESMAIIGRVLKKEKLITTIVLTVIMIFVASSIMYYVESPAQPEVFTDIIATTWWSIATFTTIWYGDVYPITVAGKILGGVISLLGIMLIALPVIRLCGQPDKNHLSEAVPKLQFLEQLFTPWRKLSSPNFLYYKELAIFSKSLFQNQPGFGTSSSYLRY